MGRATKGWKGSGRVGKDQGWLEKLGRVGEIECVVDGQGGLKRIRECWRGSRSVKEGHGEVEKTREDLRGPGRRE